MKRLSRGSPLLLFIAFGILYRWTATSQFSYDGVMYALDVEFGNKAQLFHPGHLLYSFLFRGLLSFLHHLGWSGRALFLMQRVNAWVGALAVSLLAMTLTHRYGTVRGILGASFFGLSLVFWSEAVDPGCYALTGLGGVLLLNVLLQAEEEKAWLTGVLHGVLILFHQLFIFVIPAFWLALARGKTPHGKRIIVYMLGVLAAAGIPYMAVITFFHPGSLSEKLHWFLIPAGTPPSMGVLKNSWWIWSISSNLKPFREVFVQSVVAQPFWGGIAVSFLALLAFFGSFRHFAKRSVLWPEIEILWAWIIPMIVFLFFFHHALRFHVLILPAIVCLLAAVTSDFQSRAWGLIATGGLLLLGTVNYSRAISPHRLGGDQQVKLSLVKERISSNDFLLFSGRGPHSIINVYMAYFLPHIPARSLYGYLLPQFGRMNLSMNELTFNIDDAWRRGGHAWVEKDLMDLGAQQEAEEQMQVAKGSVRAWFKKFRGAGETCGPDGYCLVELKPAFQAR